MTKRKIFNKIDKPLLILTLISLVFGVMMVGSASQLKAYMSTGSNYYYFTRQLSFICLGLFLAYCAIMLSHKAKKLFNLLIYTSVFIVLGALIYVLLEGEVSNGIMGWIYIGSYGIQPSEFAKTVLILFFAITFEKLMRYKYISNVAKVLPFVIPGLFFILVFLQPDFGTMMVLVGITLVIFLLIPYDRKTKVIFSLFAFISVLILVITMLISGKGLTKNQLNRFNFKDPCTRYRQTTGYQVCNGYIAINSGGLIGSGYGNSKQKYLYLPEAHTDFIFAIIIEEFGLIVGIAILLIYFIMVWRIILIGKKSYNLEGTIICYGVAAYIAFHIIINLGGVLGLIPLTGIPLPFYSYGGSFMVNLLVCLGMVQKISIDNKIFEQTHLVK